MKKVTGDFKVSFAEKDRSFTTKMNEKTENFSAIINPDNSSPEETFYDEIVIYDGGGVDGYGYD